MSDQKITLTARQWRDLIAPVLPFAGNDDMLPTLNAVMVETEGKWLIATTTDRFRLAIKRIEKFPTDGDESAEWPKFTALIPLRAVKSILATAKPNRNADSLTTMTFTVADDKLTVEASGLFDLFDAARFTHSLLEASGYPKVRSIIAKTLELPDDQRVSRIGVSAAFLGDYKGIGGRSTTLRILFGNATLPMLIADDEGFIGALMPRRTDRDAESWDDVLAPKVDVEPKAETEPAKPARKSRAKKTAAVSA